MTALKFIKMHGLGNDFVVFDARHSGLDLTEAQARAVSDRRTGVGCDQLIVMEPARRDGADLFMRIRNADGGEVEACGNATRCVARLVMDEKGADRAAIETAAGLLEAQGSGEGLITVDMGPAQLQWQEIPLSQKTDTLSLDISEGPLANPVAVGVGNPHAVFFVEDASDVDLATVGPILEHHPLYPNRTNVEIVEVRDSGNLRVRVWERGVGITQACGTGACASLVAAVRRELCGRAAEVELDGGVLSIEWRDDNHILMTGPAALSFTGTWFVT